MTEPPDRASFWYMAGYGIFCLEGDWGRLTDRTSVRLGLDMLMTVRRDRLIHRNAATVEEFQHYFSRWAKAEYSGFPLAYLSYHGSPGHLDVGKAGITLDEIAAMVRRPLTDRILYFGSCGTLSVPDKELRAFARNTGARAVAGYTEDVDWNESAAFDFTLLPGLLEATNVRALYTTLEENHPWFVKRLGFRVATANWASGS